MAVDELLTRNELGATELVMDLLFSTLDHAVESLSEGGDLIPFRLSINRDGHRGLDRFAFDSIDASRAALVSSTQELPVDIVAYAFATEGFLTIEGHEYSAVLIEAADRDMSFAIHFMQRFRPFRSGVPLVRIGNPGYLGTTPNLFRPAT